MSGKRFRFSLSSVLKLRQYESEQARLDLGRTQMERVKQEEQVDQCWQALHEINDHEPRGGRVSLTDIRRQDAHRLDAQRNYDQARHRLEVLRKHEEKARIHLKDRHSAEETFQSLHDTEKARHLKAQEEADNAFMDEQAITGFQRLRKVAS